jgi:hypothetical protein
VSDGRQTFDAVFLSDGDPGDDPKEWTPANKAKIDGALQQAKLNYPSIGKMVSFKIYKERWAPPQLKGKVHPRYWKIHIEAVFETLQ